ncbi:MAG: SET domain-containing protein [Ilumatobacteraceae bacterium]
MENYRTPSAEWRDLGNKGFGTFALHPIPAGSLVATFGGTASTFGGLQRFSAERVSRSIQIEANLFFVGPVEREPGDTINHSCEPNCGMRNATQVVTMRDIEVGEELTFDYAMSDMAPYDEFDCACGNASCRGRVTGRDWQLPHLQDRYAGYFSPYLDREITAARIARPLKKHEVESLMARYDHNPIDALTAALRVVTGHRTGTWEHLVALLPRRWHDGLIAADTATMDLLAAELNETRTVSRH